MVIAGHCIHKTSEERKQEAKVFELYAHGCYSFSRQRTTLSPNVSQDMLLYTYYQPASADSAEARTAPELYKLQDSRYKFRTMVADGAIRADIAFI